MKVGDVITTAEGGRPIVLRLARLESLDLAKADGEKARVGRSMKEALPLDFLELYARAMRERWSVKIDSSLLETLQKPGG